jgi:hypothetical protein
MAVKDIYRLNYPVDQADLVDQINRVLQKLMDRFDALDRTDATIIRQALVTYASDPEATAYATLGAGADIASMADLNLLRVAFENLRTMVEDLRTKLIATSVVS